MSFRGSTSILCLCVLTCGLSACGNEAAAPEPANAGDTQTTTAGRYRLPQGTDAREFLASLRATNESASGIWLEKSLVEFLPNQKFSVDGGAPQTTTDGVVVGTISSVLPGRGYAVVSEEPDTAWEDADRGTEVAFDDPNAEWHIAEVTVDVARAFGTEEGAETVRFGALITGPDVGAQMNGLEQLGSVAVIIDEKGRYAWDEDLYSIARGDLLGDVDPAGMIGFPALGDESGAFVGPVDTLADLESASTVVRDPIKASFIDGVLKRD